MPSSRCFAKSCNLRQCLKGLGRREGLAKGQPRRWRGRWPGNGVVQGHQQAEALYAAVSLRLPGLHLEGIEHT